MKTKLFINHFVIIIGFFIASCSNYNIKSSLAYRSYASETEDCAKVLSNVLADESLAKVSGFKYLWQKVDEIKYLDKSNLHAMLLRFKIIFFGKGKNNEIVSLTKIKPIHPITRETAIEKTQARTKAIKNYVDKNGLPEVFTADIQEKTIRSRELIRAVKTDEGDYILFDGNGRLYAIRDYFKSEGVKDIGIEVEVHDVDYKKIKWLFERRRFEVYKQGEELSQSRKDLYQPQYSDKFIDKTISSLDEMLQTPNRTSELKSFIKKARRKYRNIQIWRERAYSDAYKEGLTSAQISKMVERKMPLGFSSEKEFLDFKKDLAFSLRGGDVGFLVKGLSTSFYAENPTRRAGAHFKLKGPLKSPIEVIVYQSEKNRKKINLKKWKRILNRNIVIKYTNDAISTIENGFIYHR